MSVCLLLTTCNDSSLILQSIFDSLIIVILFCADNSSDADNESTVNVDAEKIVAGVTSNMTNNGVPSEGKHD